MKNLIFIVLFLFTATTVIGSDQVEIKIPRYNKKINTFSGKYSDTQSFHIIFTRNLRKRNYESFFYLYDGKQVINFPILENHESYDVVSYHSKNGVINLILSYTSKERDYKRIVSYDTTSLSIKQSNPISHQDFLTSISEKEESVLIYKSDKSFRISHFIGSQEPQKKSLDISRIHVLYKFFNEQSVSVIKTDEFVANGSTNSIRIYKDKNILYFTRDSNKPLNTSIKNLSFNNMNSNITQLFSLNLNEDTINTRFFTIRSNNIIEFKKTISFVKDHKLYQLSLSKKNGVISIADIYDASKQKSYFLDTSIAKYINGNSSFSGIDDFLKNANKSKYIPTLTINKTMSNNLRIRLDYVDINYYYNNYWFHHWHMQQHQIFMQQNMQRLVPTGFGPFTENDTTFENATVLLEKRFFELIVDPNGVLLESDNTKLFYKQYNKKKYYKVLNENKKLKHISSCFLENDFRGFAYNKKTKRFIFENYKL